MLAEIGQHDGRAAILEAAGGIEPFELEEGAMITLRLLDERRQPLTHRYRIGDLERLGPQFLHKVLFELSMSSRKIPG